MIDPIQRGVITVGSTADFRQAFVQRLIDACDANENIPPANKGRQQHIANTMGVAPEAVSKWFKGVAMPRPDKLVTLAALLGVEETWLAYGISPEMDRGERHAYGKVVEGAVYLAMGLAMLAGWHCGVPSTKDARASSVDFYATYRGSTIAIRVVLARETEAGDFELMLPKDYASVHCIGVIPAGRGVFDLLHLTPELIDLNRSRKDGSYTVLIQRAGGKYASGQSIWPRIRDFQDLK